MRCREVIDDLNDYIDGLLDGERDQRILTHLGQCEACRQEHEGLKSLMNHTENLSREIDPPHELWPQIEARIAPPESRLDAHPGVESSRRIRPRPGGRRRMRLVAWSSAAGIVLILAFLSMFWVIGPSLGDSWQVSALAGKPRVGAGHIDSEGRLAVGEWLETDGESKVKLDVARIGEILVEPNSLLRLVQSKWLEHRIALDRGTIQARIWAPPRVFVVDTPSATAIDLGCAYTLEVDHRGASLLHVTSGRVGLELNGREAFVPAGASCLTEPGSGPGTPYFEDASSGFKEALRMFDSGEYDAEHMQILLSEARLVDTLTLWHLLFRVRPADRDQIYAAIAALEPALDALDPEAIVALDENTLERAKKTLDDHWQREDVPFWKEIWWDLW